MFVTRMSVKKAKKENSESEVTTHIGHIRLKDEELKVIRLKSCHRLALRSFFGKEPKRL